MPVKQIFYTNKIMAAVKERQVVPLLTLLGAEYTNEVKRLMRSSPRGGKEYRRGKKVLRRSAPGEPPAPDTGDLIKSIRFRLSGGSPATAMEAGSALKKALFLEFGAARLAEKPKLVRRRKKRQTGREAVWILFPRPAWGPAMATLRLKMPQLIRQARAGKIKLRK